MSQEYLDIVEKARKNVLQLTKSNYTQIHNIYKDASKELGVKSSKAKRNSLTDRWLKDYKKNIDKTISDISKELNKIIREDIRKSAKYGTDIQISFFSLLDNKYDLGIDNRFNTLFSKVPDEAIKEIISGSIYEDGKGLSTRLWFNGNKVNGDLQYIINQAIAEKKSAYDLASDLEKYVNPTARKSFEWKKVYPNMANKRVDYNAQRLARTSISHAYTLGTLRSSKRNPYIEYIRWRSVLNHTRTCDICRERHEKLYLIEECPLDHPSGLCSQLPELTKSLDEIGSELGKWLKGGSNPMLDSWYKEYGKEFAI